MPSIRSGGEAAHGGRDECGHLANPCRIDVEIGEGAFARVVPSRFPGGELSRGEREFAFQLGDVVGECRAQRFNSQRFRRAQADEHGVDKAGYPFPQGAVGAALAGRSPAARRVAQHRGPQAVDITELVLG